jgi:hypothetical protein
MAGYISVRVALWADNIMVLPTRVQRNRHELVASPPCKLTCDNDVTLRGSVRCLSLYMIQQDAGCTHKLALEVQLRRRKLPPLWPVSERLILELLHQVGAR